MNFKNTGRQQTKLENLKKKDFLSTHPYRLTAKYCQLPIEMMEYQMTK